MTQQVALEDSMGIARPDRVVRTLTAFVSFCYFFMWVLAALVLIGLPMLKMFGGAGGGFYYGLELPVTAPTVQTTVQTVWGPAPLMLDEVRGKLKLPISTMPWSFLALLWSYAALGGALMLLFSTISGVSSRAFETARRSMRRMSRGSECWACCCWRVPASRPSRSWRPQSRCGGGSRRAAVSPSRPGSTLI